MTKHYYTILSSTEVLGKTITKKEVSALYRTTNWKTSTNQATLQEIIARKELITIRTDNLIVIDFDDTPTFHEALKYNETLAPKYQCSLIVASSRHGGHLYFSPNPDIEPPIGHTKQQILDYLSTEKHNVIAPTVGDSGKTIVHNTLSDNDNGGDLTQYSQPWDIFVSHIVMSNIPENAKNIVLRSDTSHSDDNIDFIKQYLSNIITDYQFNEFYNVPYPIPQGGSNEIYKRVSTRLACDETINYEDYVATMVKFNSFHARKTDSELASEHLNRMRPDSNGTSSNGLWKYDPDKQVATFKVQHKMYKTTINCFFDMNTGEYLVAYPDTESTPHLHTLKSKQMYLELLEKLAKLGPVQRKTDNVPAITTQTDYSKSYGYDKKSNSFNKAIVGPTLAAFYGTKPENYKYPQKLLECCKYMWGDEYDYLLASTKYRYTHFKFSPVITFLQGAEGSGKDLTISLLTKPFPIEPQLLDAQLVNDKHSNWQTEPNAIVSEVGDWREMDANTLLAKLKSISGSNGIVTYRGMQKTAITVPSLIKVWVTGNKWVKLHSDPMSQRRIHIVYMPRPLNRLLGGEYTDNDIHHLMSEESLLNFYYWLGNESEYNMTLDDYKAPISRQKSESYKTYIENTQSVSDTVAQLLYSRTYNNLVKIFEIYNMTLDDLTWKYSRGNLVLATARLKDVFGTKNGGDIINKTIDRLTSEKEGNKRLKFDRSIVEKFITIFEAPQDLEYSEISSEDLDI